VIERKDPWPPLQLLLGFVGFSAIAAGKDWRLGVGMLVFFTVCVLIQHGLYLRYQRVARRSLARPTDDEPTQSDAA
jgi:hypothetical protein